MRANRLRILVVPTLFTRELDEAIELPGALVGVTLLPQEVSRHPEVVGVDDGDHRNVRRRKLGEFDVRAAARVDMEA